MRLALGRLVYHLRLAEAAYGVLLISLLLTELAWYYVRQTVDAQNQVRFDETVQATRAAVDRRTDAYIDALFGARGLFLASKSIERGEWEGYVRGIETKSRLGGLQALGFAKYVKPEEREAFQEEARKEGLLEMQPDLNPGGERSAYFPLTFVAPSGKANLSVLDEDAYTDPSHKAAMDRARSATRRKNISRIHPCARGPSILKTASGCSPRTSARTRPAIQTAWSTAGSRATGGAVGARGGRAGQGL